MDSADELELECLWRSAPSPTLPSVIDIARCEFIKCIFGVCIQCLFNILDIVIRGSRARLLWL